MYHDQTYPSPLIFGVRQQVFVKKVKAACGSLHCKGLLLNIRFFHIFVESCVVIFIPHHLSWVWHFSVFHRILNCLKTLNIFKFCHQTRIRNPEKFYHCVYFFHFSVKIKIVGTLGITLSYQFFFCKHYQRKHTHNCINRLISFRNNRSAHVHLM